MSKAILGRKLGMTQIFTEEGKVVPVTVVESGNNIVIQNKTVETDQRSAARLWRNQGEQGQQANERPFRQGWREAGEVHSRDAPSGSF